MKNVCLTNDSINCTNVTNAVPPVTCETLDAVKCIQSDQAACNSVITQGISQIKDLLTDGVSCSLTSGGGPVNLEPLAQLIGTSTNCIGNNICGTVLGKQNLTMLDTTKIKGSLERMEGTINKIILNLGQDKDTIDGQTTVLSELSNLEGLVNAGNSLLNNSTNGLGSIANDLGSITNDLTAIKAALSNSSNSSGSCDLSSVTTSIGTYPGASEVGNTRGFNSLFNVIGHTADRMAADAANDGSLMAKSNAMLLKLGSYPGIQSLTPATNSTSVFTMIGNTGDTGGSSTAGSLMAKSNALIASKYLKCSDFNTFITDLNASLQGIFNTTGSTSTYTSINTITC
jgi:hypothetical protein